MSDQDRRTRSGEHQAIVECEKRLDVLEPRTDLLEERVGFLMQADKDKTDKLHAGELVFLSIKKDVESLTGSVDKLSETIQAAVRWTLGIVGTTAVGAIVWALAHSVVGK